MSKRISKINDVELRILESNPPQLLIQCAGLASSSGWGNPHLVPLKSEPKNGIYEYEFVADPPAGIVLPVLSPIVASLQLSEIPGDFKGVLIHSATNSEEQTVATDQPEGPSSPVKNVEPLLGAAVVNDKLLLRVRSGGCTSKRNFQVEINRGFTGVPPFFVIIYRVMEDHCDAHLPDGIELTYSFAELGLDPGTDLFITNPIGRRFAMPNRPVMPDPIQWPPIPFPWPTSPPPIPWPWPQPDPGPWPPHPWNPFDPRNPWGPAGPRPMNPFGGGSIGGRNGKFLN